MAVVKLSQEQQYVEYYSKMISEKHNLLTALSETSSDDPEKVHYFFIVI